MPAKQIVVGVTGASGAVYARRLLQCLCEGGTHVHLVISPHGRQLLKDELGIIEPSVSALVGRDDASMTVYPYRDVGARIASGSFHTDGMIVCPCSSNTLGAIAAGLGNNLLDRAAAVTLKEARRLILVPREMPLSQIELRNALRLSEAGAIICPASPGFYMLPQSIDDLVDFVVGKLLDLVNVPHTLNTRWADQLEASRAKPVQPEAP
ncbi:MAG: UbiX family flavin prenyltransferase [Phycisphaerales bacterium]|nr:MAG: UbiX family flavin prenyltransferase [Phycisphaerales bacterium]